MSKIKFYKDSAKTQQVYPELDPEDITKFESLEDIENAFPNVSGEDTNLTLNHTVEAPMRLELAPSELEQETTTGYNLANLITDDNNGQYTYANGTYTSKTISKNYDGFSINQNSNINLNANDVIYYSAMIRVKSGTPLYMNTIGSTNGKYNKETIQNPKLNNEFQKIIYKATATEDTSYSGIYFQIQGYVDDIVLEVQDIMITKENPLNLNYEPYTGGQPSPSPKFPMDIHTISGDNEITVVNQNKLTAPSTSYTQTRNGMTLSYNTSNEHILTGTATTQTTITVGNLLKYYTIQNNDYLHLCNNEIPTGTIQIVGVSSTNRQIFANTINGRNYILDLSPYVGQTLGHLQFYSVSGASVTNMRMTPMILNGVSAATNYIKHQEQSLPLNLPVENLFDKDNANILNAYISGDEVIKPSGYDRTIWIQIKNNKNYSIKITQIALASSTVADDLQIGLFSTIPELNLKGIRKFNKSRPLANEDFTFSTIINTENYNYLAIKVCNTTRTDFIKTLETLQIEEGSKVNSYTPYGTTPLEYCKIGTYSDEFFKNDPSDPNYDSSLELDRWYLKKNIGKVVVDGSLVQLISNYTNIEYGSINKPNNFAGNNFYDQIRVICDKAHYVATPSWDSVSNVGIISGNADKFKWWVGFIKDTGITNIQNTLNGVEIYYPLINSEYILLSDTLQHQLEDIYNWVESYPGQTNISQINNDLPFIISARAMKDLSVIDKYPTENSEHLVESGGVYEVVNDVAAVQDEHTAQIKALERASLIYNAMPKTTATGTDLTINDTAESPLKMSLGASELEQETTSGKNLLPKANNTFPKTFDELTINMNNDGSYEITGTKTTSGYSTCYLSLPQTITIPAGTYSVNYVTLQASGTESGTYKNLSGTFTITEPYRFNSFYWATNKAKTYNETIYPQLESGSTKTSFEPYTGGNPAPNPEFPMDIHTISGDNEIKVENVNLFNYDTFKGTLSEEINNGVLCLKLSGNTRTYNFNGKENQRYSFQFKYISKTSSDIGTFEFVYSDNTTSEIKYTGQMASSGTVYSALSTANKTVIAIKWNAWSSGQYLYIDKNSFQLEEGSKTDYTPHQEQSLPLNLPVENLFDKEATTYGYYYDSNGEYVVVNETYLSDYIEVNVGEKYTYQAKEDHSNKRINYFDSNKTWLSQEVVTNASYTFTIPNNTKYIRLGLNIAVNKNDIQIEKGTKTNSYISYGTTPLEYCKIGSYADEFIIPSGTQLWDEETRLGFYNDSSVWVNRNDVLSSKNPIYVEPSTTYYFTTPVQIFYTQWKSDGTFISRTMLNSPGGTINTNSECAYIHFNLLASYGTTYKNDIMLNKGTTALPYEPYNNGKWYLKKNVGKIVLDGSETISYNISNQVFYINIDNVDSKNNFIPSSNYFIGQSKINSFNELQNNKISFRVNTSSLFLKNTNITTVADFKTWLSIHNTEVYYALATPTYIPLNDALQSQLNDIAEAISYQDQTNISQINNDLPFTITATAVQDINKLIATLTNAIIETGGE